MRVWDQVAPEHLCRKHLLGEHREVHCIWTYVTTDKGGSYKQHPEVKRWVGHLTALWQRHDAIAAEMRRRGYNHKSPLAFVLMEEDHPDWPDPWDDQWSVLRGKDCDCVV